MKKLIVVKVGIANLPTGKATEYMKVVEQKFSKLFKKRKFVVFGRKDSSDIEVQTIEY